MSSITLEVTHRTAPVGPIDGFRHLWARYVRGFDPRVHCQECLVGTTAPKFAREAAGRGRAVTFALGERYPYLYICGVASGPKAERGRKNLHFPLRPAPGETATITTFNGYVFTACDAAMMPIPALPAGWQGRDLETTRCRNFQFGVAYFGADGRGIP